MVIKKVRAYLIDIARKKDSFVSYSQLVKDCNLDIDTQSEYGRKQLSQLLGEVSEFEDKQAPPRPLLSALAIYKDKEKNDHGDGFYRIAERLGKGSFKNLKDELYGFSEAERCRIYWQDDNNYKLLALTDNQEINKPFTEPDFFTKEELDFFKRWQYKPYDPHDKEHVEAKNYLMQTVWEKSIYLTKQVVNRLEGFTFEGKKIWHQRGWRENDDGVNVQGSIFKPYTWVKVYKNIDQGKSIFFTFGVEAYKETEAFVYKIDCQKNGSSNLNQEQISVIQSMIPDSAKWNEISFEDLVSENWESLTKTCVDFVLQHLPDYDKIIKEVWPNQSSTIVLRDKLIRRDKPTDGFTSFPESKSNFVGVDIDFLEKARQQKEIGNAGEDLVVLEEIRFLKERGLHRESNLVDIVMDGLGYDIISFDENGKEKFIEVKTTTGDKYTRFYLSKNEVKFMRENPGQYSIYRVYNYDFQNNTGEFFEIKGLVEDQIIMNPTQYEVVIKQTK